jgi:hypothetical protein
VPSSLPFHALLDEVYTREGAVRPVEPTLFDVRPPCAPPSTECEATRPRYVPVGNPDTKPDRARRIFAAALAKRRAGDDADAALDALLAAAIDPANATYKSAARRWGA